jgi:FMN-dependent NADH-azoreductase
MPTLLVIEVSPRFDHSTSRKLTAVYIEAWRTANPGGTVVVRDLAETNLPFVDLAWIEGAFTPPETHSPASAAAIAMSDALVAELKSADQPLIGTPVFNFSIPAALKAYIDHITRVGVTVSPTNVGLLAGKSADIIFASGGDFSLGSPVEKYDCASGYLRLVLAWIGITDVNIVRAGRALAGQQGETAVERLGVTVRTAARERRAASNLAA